MFEIIKKALLVIVILFFAKYFWQKDSDNRNYQSWPTAPAHLISAEVAVGKKSVGRAIL